MQVKGRGMRVYAASAAFIAVLVVSARAGVGRAQGAYAVGNERADSSLERLRSALSRLVDPILPLFLEEQTTYPPGFREESFRSLSAGMTEMDVRQALGAPLSDRMLADGRRILYYSEQATPTANYFLRLVVFDGQGRLQERHAEFYVD